MEALQQLLEEGSCQVPGEAGRRYVLRLSSLLQYSGGIGRMGSSNTRQRIKETWIVRQTEDQPV